LGGSDEGRIEHFDEETGDLTRTLAYSRSEPLESGRYSVTDPRARIILDDGRAIEITSRTARFVRRGQSNEPQSGEFRGDVRIRLLESSGEDAVGMTIATDSLRFDSTLGELRTTDRVVATSEETEFSGEGLTAVYSEADRKLLYMRIDRGDSFTWTPSDESSSVVARDDGETPPAAQPSPAQGERTFYRALFTGPLTIESGARTVEAERLELWALLLDGGLSPDAITRVRFSSGERDNTSPAAATQGDLLGAGGESVTLRWSGPLEIQPLDERPGELANDQVFARLSSPTQGLVRVRDNQAGAEASGVSFEYGLTSGAFTIAGVGPRGVTIRAVDRAEALAGRFEANLAAGTASFSGPGTLRALRDELADAPLDTTGEPLPRDVSWRGRADFTLARNDEGELLGALRKAVFADGVLARDAGREASA
ncbi:MAG: LPS export ABC transporter periplasmic protein LptC, partial [Phycisphaerales bacterium]